MGDLDIYLISETATAVTIGWAPPVGAQGYVFITVDGKKSSTMDGSRASVKVAKSNLPVTVRAFRTDSEGVYPPAAPPPPPPSPPTSTFGALLPPRIPQSTGPVVNVATLAELTAALTGAEEGSTINITQSIAAPSQFQTASYIISRNCAAAAPITVTASSGVLITGFLQWYITGSYLRFRGLDISRGDCPLKPTDNAHHIDIDGCHLHDGSGQGILVSGSVHDIQIWNTRIHGQGGDNGNQDHGIYWSHNAGTGSVVGNCVIYDNGGGYGMQVYPSTPGLIVTGCTIDGGVPATDGTVRGGVVVGDTPATKNVRFVGCIVTNAPGAAGWHEDGAAEPSNVVADSIAFGNKGGNPGSGMTFANVKVADPLYADRAAHDYRLKAGSPAIGLVTQANYGLLPATDITGKPRVTADAGAYAA